MHVHTQVYMYIQLFVCLKLPMVFNVNGGDIGPSTQNKQRV